MTHYGKWFWSLFSLLLFWLFYFILTSHAQMDIHAWPTVTPHCPLYAPTCVLTWELVEETRTPNPQPTGLVPDWSGEILVTVGSYRVFSDASTLVLVESRTGDIALWMEVTGSLTPGDEHVLLADNGIVSVYLLTTGEIQIDVVEGEVVKRLIADGLPIVDPAYSEGVEE